LAGAVGAATGTSVVRGIAAPAVLDWSGPTWDPERDQNMSRMASPTIMTGKMIAYGIFFLIRDLVFEVMPLLDLRSYWKISFTMAA
jgi:hypothetical protein